MLNYLKNLFKKKSNIIDANDFKPTYTMAINPEGKLIIENETRVAIVAGVHQMPKITAYLHGLPTDKTVLDIIVYESSIKEKTSI
jgi:hypothetical protein